MRRFAPTGIPPLATSQHDDAAVESVKDPVVLFDAHITIDSATYPCGKRTRAIHLQPKVAQSTPDGILHSSAPRHSF